MAETSGLLNRRSLKGLPRVRIPPSPPFSFVFIMLRALREQLKAAVQASLRHDPRRRKLIRPIGPHARVEDEFPIGRLRSEFAMASHPAVLRLCRPDIEPERPSFNRPSCPTTPPARSSHRCSIGARWATSFSMPHLATDLPGHAALILWIAARQLPSGRSVLQRTPARHEQVFEVGQRRACDMLE